MPVGETSEPGPGEHTSVPDISPQPGEAAAGTEIGDAEERRGTAESGQPVARPPLQTIKSILRRPGINGESRINDEPRSIVWRDLATSAELVDVHPYEPRYAESSCKAPSVHDACIMPMRMVHAKHCVSALCHAHYTPWPSVSQSVCMNCSAPGMTHYLSPCSESVYSDDYGHSQHGPVCCVVS